MASPRWALLALALLLLTGCATSTRIARMGPLPSLEPLVTLVVSDDRRVVERACRDVAALGFPDPHRSEAHRETRRAPRGRLNRLRPAPSRSTV
jgi:hypothetical protein